MRLRTFMAGCVLTASALTAHADTITYTVTDTGSGSLGGLSFANQLLTVSFTGNTATGTTGTNFYENAAGTGTVEIGNGPVIAFTEPLDFFVNQNYTGNGPKTGAAGIGGLSGSILDTESNLFETYSGTTAIGPITGPAYINPGFSFNTASGAFIINSAGANSTFTASAVASTPEPSSLALLGTGVLGMAGVIRKRRMSA